MNYFLMKEQHPYNGQQFYNKLEKTLKVSSKMVVGKLY